MIDINAIISQALAAAVQQATAPLLERIAALETGTAEMESVSKERHERQLFVLQHLTARIAALENDHDDMVMKHELPDMYDYVKRDYLDSAVRDAVHDTLDNATLSIRF